MSRQGKRPAPHGPATPGQPAPQTERNNIEKSLKRWGLVFTGPTLVAFIIAFLAPFFIGIHLSLTKLITVTNATSNRIDSCIKALSERQDFVSTLAFTAVAIIIAIISVNIFVSAIAYLLTRKLRDANFFRTVFSMSNLIGGIVLGYTWQTVINAVLRNSNTTLVTSAKYGLFGLILLLNWQQVGYMMVIYIAGLQSVPPELVETTRIDGASRWRIMRNVTIPMIMPSITIYTFLTLSNSFKLFDQNLALTNGAPQHATEMAALNIVNTFFGEPGYEGVGQAKAMVFFLIATPIAFLQPRLTHSKGVES